MKRNFLSNIDEILVGILLGLMCLLIFSNVVMRYAFDHPLYFADELACFMMIWMAFIGAAVNLKKGEHIKVAILMERLRPKWRLRLKIFNDIMVLIFVVIMLLYGVKLTLDAHILLTPAMEMPTSYLYAIVPASALAMLLRIRTWFGKTKDVAAVKRTGKE